MSRSLELFQSLSKRYPTPEKVQTFIRSLEYNIEANGETVSSAIEAYRRKSVHCLEASFLSAAILEHQGFPPLVLNLDSADNLNHALFVFKSDTGWGAISRSREEGLHGRAPHFATIRELALSYYEPYVDDTGKIIGYELIDLDEIGVDWRLSRRNLWKVEETVTTLKFKKIRIGRERFNSLFERYRTEGPINSGLHWW